MNKKSFIIGMVMGIALTFGFFLIVGYFTQQQKNNSIQYLEKPVSYEDKEIASFEVIQVIDQNAALASDEGVSGLYNKVVLLGSDFYSGQTITLINPQRIGSYSYTSVGGMPMTVPIVKGEIGTDRREEPTDQKEVAYNRSERLHQDKQEPFRYLEQPESYEGKKKTSFKVDKVVQDGYALAREEDGEYGITSYYGNKVLLVGEDFYDGQVITILNPQKIGIFKHYGETVPVIDGESK